MLIQLIWHSPLVWTNPKVTLYGVRSVTHSGLPTTFIASSPRIMNRMPEFRGSRPIAKIKVRPVAKTELANNPDLRSVFRPIRGDAVVCNLFDGLEGQHKSLLYAKYRSASTQTGGDRSTGSPTGH